MNFGMLVDEVTIKTVTSTSSGDSLATVRTQWCLIEPAGGKAIELARAEGKETTHKITFRNDQAIVAAHMIVDADGLIYRIDVIKDFRDKGYQEVFCHVTDAET